MRHLAASIALCASTAIATPDFIQRQDLDGDAMFRFDVQAFATIRGPVVLRAVELSPGEFYDLQVEPAEVFDPRGKGPIIADGDRERPLDLTGLTLVHGHLADDPGSLVFVGVSPWGVQGVIDTGDHRRTWSISSGPYNPLADAGTAWITETSKLSFDGTGWACGVEPADEYYPRDEVDVTDGDMPTEGPCTIIRVAIDTEWEMTRDFSNDPQAAAAYAVSLLGAVSEVYQRELNVGITIPYLRVWESDTDPYDSGQSSLELLSQFRNHWRSQMGSVSRELAHILSPKVSGGIGLIGVLCNKSRGYAASGINLFFPYPIQDHQNSNWDLFIVTHEIGHNLGSPHTHDFSPPIDNCGNGDCTGAYGGTLMSYCHQCPPSGVGNIVLAFHPTVKDTINDYLAHSCSTDGGSLMGIDETVRTPRETPVMIDVLANETSRTCITEVALESIDATSAMGGVIEVVIGGGAMGADSVRYTPPVGFVGTDSFTYVARSGSKTAAATTRINVEALRIPDIAQGTVAPGVDVSWFALSPGVSALPAFDTLTAYATSTTTAIDFPSTAGLFADSGLADGLGGVFEGYLAIPTSGLWTLSVESDDGAKLWIGDDLVVDNDYLHGMREAQGTIALDAGLHAVRIEFFERADGAGLIARWTGPDTARETVPASAWFRDAAVCAPDLTGDGAINTNDFFAFLALYQTMDSRADYTADGLINTNDFFAFLALYQQGC